MQTEPMQDSPPDADVLEDVSKKRARECNLVLRYSKIFAKTSARFGSSFTKENSVAKQNFNISWILLDIFKELNESKYYKMVASRTDLEKAFTSEHVTNFEEFMDTRTLGSIAVFSSNIVEALANMPVTEDSVSIMESFDEMLEIVCGHLPRLMFCKPFSWGHPVQYSQCLRMHNTHVRNLMKILDSVYEASGTTCCVKSDE